VSYLIHADIILDSLPLVALRADSYLSKQINCQFIISYSDHIERHMPEDNLNGLVAAFKLRYGLTGQFDTGYPD
jgi:hypothetical protein